MKEERKRKPARGPRRGTPAEATSPSPEDIARRAYEIFLARGGEPGHEQEDWLQAESELREDRAKA
jgi:hypothetical protein